MHCGKMYQILALYFGIIVAKWNNYTQILEIQMQSDTIMSRFWKSNHKWKELYPDFGNPDTIGYNYVQILEI